MSYKVNIGMEDSPVLSSATFKSKEEARAFRRGFARAQFLIGGINHEVYWTQMVKKSVNGGK